MKDFEVLLDGAYPSSVAMSRDILDAASTLAPAVGAPRPTWGMHSLSGGRVHLRDGISIETAKLPPRRSVRHATGNSLIQSIRMRRARDLLQNSRMPMEQVAAAVGYADTTALRRLLRRTTGQPPATFRSSLSVAR
jgi:AraC-like DNA-binding protein